MFLDKVDFFVKHYEILHDMTFVLVLAELRSKKTVIGIIYNQTNKKEDWYLLTSFKAFIYGIIKYYNHIIIHRKRIPVIERRNIDLICLLSIGLN